MTTTAPAKLMSAEEFLEWSERPENRDVAYELEEGRAVAVSRPTKLHGIFCWMVARILTEYLTRRKSGFLATNDSGFIVRRKPDTLRGPDIMLFLKNPKRTDMEKYVERTTPDLIVEVRSPNDKETRLNRRIEGYINRKVPMVWVLDYEKEIVTSYRPGEFPKVYDVDDVMIGNGVLPGFKCAVAELFTLPGETR